MIWMKDTFVSYLTISKINANKLIKISCIEMISLQH